jgi:hypothetical protein
MCSATALLWERMRSRSASSSHALLLTCTTFLPPRCLRRTKQGPDQIRSSKDNPPEDEKAGQLHWRCPGASPGPLATVTLPAPGSGATDARAHRTGQSRIPYPSPAARRGTQLRGGRCRGQPLQQRVPTAVVISPVMVGPASRWGHHDRPQPCRAGTVTYCREAPQRRGIT